jgi:cobalt/nickel transport system permease protein
MKTNSYLEIGQMDELGRLDTPLHRLDARVKTVTVLLFVITVMSFSRYRIAELMPLFLFPCALIGIGNIPVSAILKKTAIAAPFALFVGIFNPLFDHQTVQLFGSREISAGWFSFASILIRFLLTVSAALILVASTGIHRLCAGLERMGVPSLFAVQILFLYRYLFVIGEEALRMIRSVRIRSAGPGKPTLRTYGSLAGTLLIRSMDRAQRVYRAMVSRGFNGQVHILHRSSPGLRDAIFLFGWTAFFLLVRFWSPAVAIGRQMTGGVQ